MADNEDELVDYDEEEVRKVVGGSNDTRQECPNGHSRPESGADARSLVA